MSDETNIEYKYTVQATNRFKKHARLVKERNAKNADKIKRTVEMLAKGEPLPERFCDHELTGNYAGHRECHILPDLLLIYRIYKSVLILELVDTGTHSDLFGK